MTTDRASWSVPSLVSSLVVTAVLSAGCPGDPELCEEAVPAEIPSSVAEPVATSSLAYNLQYSIADGRVGFVADTPGVFGNRDLMVWDGTAWDRRPMATGPMSFIVNLGPILQVMGSQFVAAFQFGRSGDLVSDAKYFQELPNGSFSEQPAQPEPRQNFSLNAFSTDGESRAIVAGRNSTNIITVTEKNGDQAFTRQTVSTGAVNLEGAPIGVGYTQAGVAWMVFRDPSGNVAFTRRTGSVWTAPVTLYTPAVDESLLSVQTFQTPSGGAEQKVFVTAIRRKAASSKFQVTAVDLGTFAVSASADLMNLNQNATIFGNVNYFAMAFSAESGTGVYAIHHPLTNQIMLGSYGGAGLFSSSQDLFDVARITGNTPPALYFDGCNKPIIMHRLRDVGANEVDTPIQFEALEPEAFDGI